MTNNYALIAGHDGGTLCAVKNDLNAIELELVKRGFANIRKLYNEDEATKDDFFEHMETISRLTDEDSRFIFHYSGHGSEKGLYLPRTIAGSFKTAEYLSPAELYGSLGKLKGKKAVFLDCCHAGIFINTGIDVPPHTLVIAATGGDKKAYSKRTKKVGGYMGVLTSAIVGYFRANQGEINLAEMRSYLNRRLPGEYLDHFQEPEVWGTASFTLGASDPTTRVELKH